FFQYVYVVGDVAADNVGDGVDGHRIVAGDAASRPRLGRQVAEERKGSEPDGLELLDQIRPGGLVRVRAGDGDLLIETRPRVGANAREPQRQAEKNPLAVVDVVQEFPDGTVVGRIPVRRELFGNA